MDHPFCHNAIAFDGEQMQGSPPTKMSLDGILHNSNGKGNLA
jgi:hypothetical protein